VENDYEVVDITGKLIHKGNYTHEGLRKNITEFKGI